jgi:hypothetical protein
MAAEFDAANPQGISVAGAIRKGVRPEIAKAKAAEAAAGTSAAHREGLIEASRRVVKKTTPSVSATKMVDMKHVTDDVADPAFVAAAKPGGPPVLPGSEAANARALSKGYRSTLNDAVGPKFAAQGQNTKTMFGVQRMAQTAAERPEMLANLIGGAAAAPQAWEDPGQGLKTFLLYRGLADPRTLAAGSFAAPQVGRAADAMLGGAPSDMMRRALLAALSQDSSAP